MQVISDSGMTINNINNGYVVRCYSVKNNPCVSIESVSIMGNYLKSVILLGFSEKIYFLLEH